MNAFTNVTSEPSLQSTISIHSCGILVSSFIDFVNKTQIILQFSVKKIANIRREEKKVIPVLKSVHICECRFWKQHPYLQRAANGHMLKPSPKLIVTCPDITSHANGLVNVSPGIVEASLKYNWNLYE